jgi:protein TonB
MSAGAPTIMSPYLDDPLRRLVWAIPLAVLVWIALLIGFSRLLERTTPPPLELKTVEVRMVELPAEIGGLQGGSAPATAAAPAKPRPQVAKPVPMAHPRPEVHRRMKVKPVAPREPASPTGTAKTESPPASGAPAESSGATASPARGAGVTGGSGTGRGSGLGSDTAGARAIYAPVPKIPDELREDALDTVAVAHFKVGYDGQVGVELKKPTSNTELNELLLDTLKQWRFFPAMKNGVAIESEFDVRIPVTVQ